MLSYLKVIFVTVNMCLSRWVKLDMISQCKLFDLNFPIHKYQNNFQFPSPFDSKLILNFLLRKHENLGDKKVFKKHMTIFNLSIFTKNKTFLWIAFRMYKYIKKILSEKYSELNYLNKDKWKLFWFVVTLFCYETKKKNKKFYHKKITNVLNLMNIIKRVEGRCFV